MSERDQQLLSRAILQTVAYVDVFDFPLAADEIHRYLQGVAASAATVEETLQRHCHRGAIGRQGRFYMLAGREAIVATRRRRAQIARRLWPHAARYGRWIGAMPFVRMVAVTGSLAVDNVEADADIDYLIVTANDRLWLSRAFVILIVRYAARRQVPLCPNYIVSERALHFDERNLYTAHELTQMVLLSGADVYRRLRALNRWTERLLPNAVDPPSTKCAISVGGRRPLQRATERLLSSRGGARLESWEMQRKLRRFGEQAPQHGEARFAADWCKGHFEGHGQRIIDAYHERIQQFQSPL